MAIYAIGDIQGCYDELRTLVDLIAFDPAQDTLWIAGDLVNRGPQSLAVLQYLHGLGEAAVVVLGNHDLHLLAASVGARPVNPKDSFQDILQSPQRDELLEWLRGRPLIHHDADFNVTMVHAGLMPQWTMDAALRHAKEVHDALQKTTYPDLLANMYRNTSTSWCDELKGMERLSVIINACTRLRYCTQAGNMSLSAKWLPGTQPRDYYPWYAVPERKNASTRIVFGHWAALAGRVLGEQNVYALDTGCVWGGKLRALRLDDFRVFEVDSHHAKVF